MGWVLLIVAMGLIAVVVMRTRGHGAGGWLGRGPGSKVESRAWASRHDVSSLVVREPTPGRVIFGKCGRRLVAVEEQFSLLVLGPTGSGKTTGLAIPAILEWDGPVVAVSVKTDLYDTTIRRRERRGRTWVYDPTNCTGVEKPATWSPVGAARTWRGAKQMAGFIKQAASVAGLETGQ